MATVNLTRGKTLPNSSAKSDFHNLVDTATGTVTNIVNADIDSAAGIVDTKLATISTAGKVSGAALTSLSSIPSGAGVVPVANLATGTPSGAKFIRDDGTLQLPSFQTAATQAEMESASSNTVPVTPGRTQYHPGVAKAWINFNGTGTPAVNSSYNADSSITDNGTGDYTVSWTTDFSSANYAWAGAAFSSGSFARVVNSDQASTVLAGSIRIKTYDLTTNAIDPTMVSIIAFGDQA